MRTVGFILITALRSGLRSQGSLHTENAALRHQLAVLQRQARGRPRLRPGDRRWGVALSPVARLATRARHRQARHRAPVASIRLSAILNGSKPRQSRGHKP